VAVGVSVSAVSVAVRLVAVKKLSVLVGDEVLVVLGESVLVMLGLMPVGVNVNVDGDKLSILGVGDKERVLPVVLDVQVSVMLSDALWVPVGVKEEVKVALAVRVKSWVGLFEVETDSVSVPDDDGLGESERLLVSVDVIVARYVRECERVREGVHEMVRDFGALNEAVKDPVPGDGVGVRLTVLLRLVVRDCLALALADGEILTVEVKVSVVVEVAAGVQVSVGDKLAEMLGL